MLAPPNRAAGIYNYITNGEGFFGPGSPLSPMAPWTAGRQFDYQMGINLNYYPKRNEGIDFSELRALADAYDLLRLAIETCKNEMELCGWKIQTREGRENRASRVLQKDLLTPDKTHTWHQWQRMLLEELFVTDAPAIYIRRTLGNEPYALEIVDGTTIKRLLDETGRTPDDGPAYQQILHGLVTANFTRDELIYCPRNVRVNRVYGYSPVEQLITTVNIALRRQANQLSYYTEGSVPDLLFGVPEDWNCKQIEEFQAWWNSIFSNGETRNRRMARFVPHGMTPYNTKEAVLKDQYDEWLARIICFCFSLSPSALVAQVNRSTAEQMEETAKSSGLEPIKCWFKAVMDRIIADIYDQPELEFAWIQKDSIKPEIQAQIYVQYTQAGILTLNEVRAELGYEQLKYDPAAAAGQTGEAGWDGGGGNQIGSQNRPGFDKLRKIKKPTPIDHERPALKRLGRQLQKQIEIALFDNMNAVLTRIKEWEGGQGFFARLMGASLRKSAADWLALLNSIGITFDPILDDLEDILGQVAQSGATQAMGQLEAFLGAKQTQGFNDKLINQVNLKAVEWAKDHAARLVTEITDSTRAALRGIVTSGIEDGLSVPDLAGRIVDGQAFSRSRAEMIARTELAFADVRGNKIAYAESGVVAGLQWISARNGDDALCENCMINDGAIVPLGPDGMAANPYPSGAMGVPAHPNCRCDELPVIDRDME